uniref:Rab effector MyRIP/Melanophilin domain-containing protein n=1 Tax=Callorhinchus milii TaxID=7868 RepID=A0A4W3J1K8_CALMI
MSQTPQVRRSKRLLSVHPVDFDIESEYSTQSRRQSFQLPSPLYDRNGLQESYSEFSFTGSGPTDGGSRRGSLFAEADLASVFRDIIQEKGHSIAMPEQQFSTEIRMEVNARRKSLDRTKSEEIFHREHRLPRTRSVPRVWNLSGDTDLHRLLPQEKHSAQYYADMESSEDELAPEYPVYQRHFIRHRNRSGSQENSGSQISDLTKRMSSIEKMLSRLEEMTPHSAESPNLKGRHTSVSPVGSEASGVLTDADIEEEKLKKKLGELANNISDKGLSSEEENGRRKIERQQELSSSSEEIQNDAVKRSSAVALCDITTEALRTINVTEKALCDLAGADGLRYEASSNRSSHLILGEKGPSASEAKDTDEAYRKLEENVYMAAGTNYNLERQLQELEERARSRESHTTSTTDSELSELEDKVASAAAQVQHTESEVSDIENRIAALRAAGVSVSSEEKPKRKQDGQAAALQQPIRRKVSNSSATNNDAFDRNSQYKGSLTQRNPSNKRRLDHVFAVRWHSFCCFFLLSQTLTLTCVLFYRHPYQPK